MAENEKLEFDRAIIHFIYSFLPMKGNNYEARIDDVPESDVDKLKKFLKEYRNLDIDWLDAPNTNWKKDGKIIRIYDEKNSIELLKLDNDSTKVTLIIDGRKDEFHMHLRNDKLFICKENNFNKKVCKNAPLKIEEMRGFFQKGKPLERKGPMPFLDLDIEFGFIECEKYKATLNNDSISIIIEPLIRLFAQGNTCCLRMTAQKKEGTGLSTDEIQELLRLVSVRHDTYGPEIFEIENGKSKSIYGIFRHVLSEVIEKNGLGIMCESHLSKDNREPQTPWILTVLEKRGNKTPWKKNVIVPQSEKGAESPKWEEITDFEQNIAPILYRSIGNRQDKNDLKLEPAYIYSNIRNNGICNRNIDERLFVGLSRRSILCICDNFEEDPAKYLIPALLDLAEITIARWHVLVMINKILDENLKNFRGEGKPKDRLEKIIDLSNRFVSCLEDSGTYVFSGDALIEMNDELKETFRIKELTEDVLKKLDMLERLYKHGLEMRWIEEGEKFEAD